MLLSAVAVSLGIGAAGAAQASGESNRCPAGSRSSVSVLIPGTTDYLTFGPGLAWLDDQHVTDPMDVFEPGYFFQDAVAAAADGHAIVRTISKTAGSAPFVDEWGGVPAPDVLIRTPTDGPDDAAFELFVNCVV